MNHFTKLALTLLFLTLFACAKAAPSPRPTELPRRVVVFEQPEATATFTVTPLPTAIPTRVIITNTPAPLLSVPTDTPAPTDTPIPTDTPVPAEVEIATEVPPIPTDTPMPAEVPPTPTETAIPAEVAMTFSIIGDFGEVGQPVLDVANMVKNWQPQFIITVGDNNYPDGQAETIDANVGQYYHDYIGNYVGKYGPGAAENNFYPVLGNHDWLTRSGDPSLPQPYLDYFTLPNNERYYTFQRGPVAFFALDSENLEPDGNTPDSAQAAWLQRELAASAAPWKLVYLHHPPYSSDALHASNPRVQWPYKAWGASAVVAGHNHLYERLDVDGFPYFVNGTGGQAAIYKIVNVIPQSMMRHDQGYGAMLVKATDACLIFQYVILNGQVLDNFQLGQCGN